MEAPICCGYGREVRENAALEVILRSFSRKYKRATKILLLQSFFDESYWYEMDTVYSTIAPRIPIVTLYSAHGFLTQFYLLVTELYDSSTF